MIGSIAGDIISSQYEAAPIKTKAFTLLSHNCRFTEDSESYEEAVRNAVSLGGGSDTWPALEEVLPRHFIKKLEYPKLGKR